MQFNWFILVLVCFSIEGGISIQSKLELHWKMHPLIICEMNSNFYVNNEQILLISKFNKIFLSNILDNRIATTFGFYMDHIYIPHMQLCDRSINSIGSFLLRGMLLLPTKMFLHELSLISYAISCRVSNHKNSSYNTQFYITIIYTFRCCSCTLLLK